MFHNYRNTKYYLSTIRKAPVIIIDLSIKTWGDQLCRYAAEYQYFTWGAWLSNIHNPVYYQNIQYFLVRLAVRLESLVSFGLPVMKNTIIMFNRDLRLNLLFDTRRKSFGLEWINQAGIALPKISCGVENMHDSQIDIYKLSIALRHQN